MNNHLNILMIQDS